MKTILLTILDGFGINERKEYNAVKLANTPNIDHLIREWPSSTLNASGLYVGLPDGQMGNSEVGHMNIGGGRVIYQDLVKIQKDIDEGVFFKKEEFLNAIDNCKKNNTKLHLLGLVSDGGVHSHINHLIALLKLCKDNDFDNVYIHAFLDGRDTPPKSGKKYIEDLLKETERIGVGKIATISGRYYAMDRDNRWERVEKAYDAMVNGIGVKENDPIEAIENSYKNEVTDEFVIPTVINEEGLINVNDSVIFFNFRTDRPREITKALVDPNFDKFDVKKGLNLFYVCMTEYDKTIPNVHIAYKPEVLNNTLGEYVSKNGLHQLRIAETEKYAHVTFFFNGGREVEFENEDRILVPSPKVATYDMQPEMSTYKLCDKVCEAINSNKYDLIVLNFANTDMVGHTGVLEAAIKAVESVDVSLGKIMDAIKNVDGIMVLTADHGNCETMKDYETLEPHTAHTTNLVPFIIYNSDIKELKNGALCDIAPTILDLMSLDKPEEMTGNSLIVK